VIKSDILVLILLLFAHIKGKLEASKNYYHFVIM